MIQTITKQLTSITQLKHRLHAVKNVYQAVPSLEKNEDVISFSKKELATNPAVIE